MKENAIEGPAGEFHSVVTIGERGQVVIPADIRKKRNIKSGDKLIVVSRRDGPIGLIPAQEFNRFLTEATKVLSRLKSQI
ncbi:MAG: AbrB/MazE/SpoVT family DNA-binding domain-containing protein [Candidatus Omnitrophota bacterium]|jgi:AbrB family looped-hinge helix DNA binding protein